MHHTAGLRIDERTLPKAGHCTNFISITRACNYSTVMDSCGTFDATMWTSPSLDELFFVLAYNYTYVVIKSVVQTDVTCHCTFVEIEPSDRLILLTTINNWSCKITHKRDWNWSWTLNCIKSVYNIQPCNIIGCLINKIHQGFECMRINSNLA